MKKFILFFLLLFEFFNSNAGNLSVNPGPTVYYLVSPDNYTVRIGLWSVGFDSPPYHYTYNIYIPQGYYRFWRVNSGQSSNYGASGFPSGGVSSNPDNYIYIPEGTYNFYVHNGSYHFVATTPVMLLGELTSTSFSLTDNGNGTYCATNVVFANNSIEKFYLNNVTGVPFFGITTFPSGQLVNNGLTFIVPAGTYDICVNNGDMSFSFNNTLNVEEMNLEKISVYPNPTENNWNFNMIDSLNNSIVINNLIGNIVYESKNLGANFSVNSSSLIPGIYLAHILSSNNRSTVVKLIKK